MEIFIEITITFNFLQLKGKSNHQGRDHLMWVLLQFLSGSIQKNQFSDFLPVLRLIGK